MKRSWYILIAALLALSLCGCSSGAETQLPEATQAPMDVKADDGAIEWRKDRLTLDASGAPTLRVYVTQSEKTEEMDVETYVAGVLAGEMENSWPMEALRAQAILARTYAVKFLAEKESKYPGADISTDVEEAQAYNAEKVNDRVLEAVRGTRGVVMAANGKLPYAWFHAHSGGMTARAKEGLNYKYDEPSHTRVARGMETQDAPEEARAWRATFTFGEVGAACAKQGAGVQIGADTLIRIGERGESGRAVTLMIGQESVSAPELRIALGSTKLRSTLLTDITVSDSGVTFAGKGYGHGVGMSQWGANAMAKDGKNASEILTHYFQGVSLYRLWGGEATSAAR